MDQALDYPKVSDARLPRCAHFYRLEGFTMLTMLTLLTVRKLSTIIPSRCD